MSKNRNTSRTEATITSVELVFQRPNDVTRKGAVCLTLEKDGGTKKKLIFDLMEVGAKFSPPCYMNWKYKEPVKDGFVQFYDLMIFLGAKQPKELEGISVILLEKEDGFVLTRADSQFELRTKVDWWDSRNKQFFESTLAQAELES